MGDYFGMDLWLLTHADLRKTARVKAFTETLGPLIVERLKALGG